MRNDCRDTEYSWHKIHGKEWCGILFGFLWLAGPFLACYVSKPSIEEKPENQLKEEELQYLKEIAAKTWQFFDDFMQEENHYLPPDNWEETRQKKQANPDGRTIRHHTNPTTASKSQPFVDRSWA